MVLRQAQDDTFGPDNGGDSGSDYWFWEVGGWN